MCRTADINEQQSPLQWNETAGGGTAKATAALGELPGAALMLWPITQLHECGNQFLFLLNRNIEVLSPVLELEMQSPALQFMFR
jgi:hypothetical protein